MPQNQGGTQALRYQNEDLNQPLELPPYSHSGREILNSKTHFPWQESLANIILRVVQCGEVEGRNVSNSEKTELNHTQA